MSETTVCRTQSTTLHILLALTTFLMDTPRAEAKPEPSYDELIRVCLPQRRAVSDAINISAASGGRGRQQIDVAQQELSRCIKAYIDAWTPPTTPAIPGQPSLSDKICKTELANMQAEWRKLGQNGPDTGYYYRTWSQFDASAVQKQIRSHAGQIPGVLARRDDTPQYKATSIWEDCLLRTRSSQVPGPNTTDVGKLVPNSVAKAGDIQRPATATPREIAYKEGQVALEEVLAELDRQPAPKVATVNPKREEPGEDAKNCLELRAEIDATSDSRLFNTCAYRVEGLWCVVGGDCNPYYSNMHTFEVGTSYAIGGTAGSGRGRTVMYAACRGKNSIRGDSGGFFYVCKKVPN